MSLHEWYRRRERGLPSRIGDADLIYRTIFRSLQPKADISALGLPHPYPYGRECGAICNLEFSPDGTMLSAACEYKSVVLFDPLTEKQICAINNAHDASVNCIKFIDNRIFASCSDDTTVAIWDSRNLSTKLRTLNGHRGWVKNIEYSKKEGTIISSGLDGVIYSWELKNSTEQGCVYQRLLYMPGLMRCRLAPDENRLILCTSSGYLMIVHDLNLATLAGDLINFRPSIHRLNLMRKQRIPSTTRVAHPMVHKSRQNRVEFVSDFPPGNNAEIISGLTIHPQGWCALSRNVSFDEQTEWSVIHDIQSWNNDIECDEEKVSPPEQLEDPEERQHFQHDQSNHEALVNVGSSDPNAQPTNGGKMLPKNFTTVESSESWRDTIAHRDETSQHVDNIEYSDAILDVFPMNSTKCNRSNSDICSMCNCNSEPLCSNLNDGSHSKSYPGKHKQDNHAKESTTLVINQPWSPDIKRISKRKSENAPRLLYFIQESNNVEGYMREACFSPDGRVICSPHDDCGIRLLAFNEQCNEIQYATNIMENNEPQILRELEFKACHKHVVISSQFSPRFPLLVTGCLLGNIIWNLPVLS